MSSRRQSRAPWSRVALCALALLPILTAAQTAQAQEEMARGFDIQPWRPTPGPRDLLIVPQSQPLRHKSVSVGAFFSFSLDPLVLLNNEGERQLQLVRNRLEMDLMAAGGLGDWVEIGLVFPLILYQSGDNMQQVGREGSVQSFARGDLAMIAKGAIVRRLSYAKGFGMSALLRVNAPTGEAEAYAGAGGWTFSPTLNADYRFGGGTLIAAQAGVYYRPLIEFQSVAIGPGFVGALGAEIPLVRKWGLTTLGGAYVNVSFFKAPESIRQIPAELMLGLRWYASFGVTFTTGLNFGANCAIGVPAFRFFLAAVWVPGKLNEQVAIDEFKKPPDDPDGDGVIGEKDLCPDQKGTPENDGCPEADTDRDGIIDRIDDCPNLPGRRAYNGCPRVYAKENKIKILEEVHFATDQDIILPESFSVLEEVSQIIRSHPEWELIEIEGHCDSRASDAYNLDLSQRRANSVQKFLLSRGIEPSRLRAMGYGRSRPKVPNFSKDGTLSEEGMALNRRVEFTILKGPTSSSGPAPAPSR
jgi:OOP family OmpA-OmpF porin